MTVISILKIYIKVALYEWSKLHFLYIKEQTHVTTINKKRYQEYKKEQGGVYWRVWKKKSDVGFPSVCCEYHWLIMAWLDRVEQS